MVDPKILRGGLTLGIEPTAQDPGIVAALDVAGERVAHDHHFIGGKVADFLPNPLEDRLPCIQ